MYVICTAEGDIWREVSSRNLRVLGQLWEFNDPQLWRFVSSLVLKNGELELTGVIGSSADVIALEWCLTSCVRKDLRVLR